MAFVIPCQTFEQAESISQTLLEYLGRSRFKMYLKTEYSNKKYLIKLTNIRLRISKEYCGNHAGPCQVRFGGHQKRRRLNFLEGLDWVSFNNMINDALDSFKYDGNVRSSSCIIRKGRERRTDYYGIDGGEFYRDAQFCFHYKDYTKRRRTTTPKTYYQTGTPGIYEWRNR